jgi:spermidine/putrescine transport system permease protein
VRRRPDPLRWLLRLWVGLTYGVLFAPIAVVVLFSFNRPRGRFNLLWQGFTLENWRDPLGDAALSQAFLTSLAIALGAALIATVLGGAMALALARSQLRGGGWINLLLVLPLATPEVVLATALLSLFAAQGLERGPLTLLLAHSLFCLSYAALVLKARLGGVDWTLEAAALDLGASPLQAFRRVTLPLLAPGLLAAALLSFSLSFDDYVVSLFTAGSTVTLPLHIAGAFQREISPRIHVLSSLVLLASVSMLAFSSCWATATDGQAGGGNPNLPT